MPDTELTETTSEATTVTTPEPETTTESTAKAAKVKTKGGCPECGGVLVPHEGDANPYKVGAEHCNACGGCFINGKRR